MIPPGEQAIETKKCRLSGQDFVITDKDLEFYDKISPTFAGKRYQIPSPTLCPDERLRRRMCFRNERNLYKRICDKTGKEFISNYAPDAPYTVYAPEVWWADSFSYGDYARDFDDTKTFFDQFDELLRASPRMGLGSNPMSSENSAYTNYAGSNKNCYFVFT